MRRGTRELVDFHRPTQRFAFGAGHHLQELGRHGSGALATPMGSTRSRYTDEMPLLPAVNSQIA